MSFKIRSAQRPAFSAEQKPAEEPIVEVKKNSKNKTSKTIIEKTPVNDEPKRSGKGGGGGFKMRTGDQSGDCDHY